MSNVPVSENGRLQFNELVREAHALLAEARASSASELPGKLAEVESKLNSIQNLICPVMVLA